MNFKRIAASIAAVSLLAPAGGSARILAAPQLAATAAGPQSRLRYANVAQRIAEITQLQKRIKYVFVLYQENRSFDSYFGTFPNAEGLFSQPASQTLGFSQKIENTDGTFSLISPFRIDPPLYSADTDDVGHAHAELIAKVDVTSNGPQMDSYALTEELTHSGGGTPTLQDKQYGELTMAHEDCDTIPLLWNYANKFVLFDDMFQSYLGPSTPGNLTIIGAQVGETQYAFHPSEGYTDNGDGQAAVPVTNDRDPAWGPYNPGDGAGPGTVQLNLTYSTLPITLAGPTIGAVEASDPTAGTDFADIGADVKHVMQQTAMGDWGWFQEGYDQEPGETGPQSLTTYVTHHNGPQYFGYVANSSERSNLHGMGDFMTAVSAGTLPGSGVFYVKGGYQNIIGLKPVDPDPAVQADFNGDDEHPGYSDAQISEANVATNIDLIVKSKYWSQSAIIIAYDDSEGDYDNVAPPLRSIGPGNGNLPADYLSDGPRIPLIVISPYAKDHIVDHDYGDQGSVVSFVDTVFGVTALSALPDEVKARKIAAAAGKMNYGPDDGKVSGITDLVDAFDPQRLSGAKPPLTASYAYVNPSRIMNLPQKTGYGCKALGIVPVDYAQGIQNNIPPDFNPRPGTDPTQPNAKHINARQAVMKARDLDD